MNTHKWTWRCPWRLACNALLHAEAKWMLVVMVRDHLAEHRRK